MLQLLFSYPLSQKGGHVLCELCRCVMVTPGLLLFLPREPLPARLTPAVSYCALAESEDAWQKYELGQSEKTLQT